VDGPFRDPALPADEATSYRGTVRGEQLGGGTNRLAVAEHAYEQQLEIAIGEASYEVAIAFARERGFLRCTAYRAETRHGEDLVAREEGRFDGVHVLQWGGHLGPYPRAVTPLLGAALALRGLDFAKGVEWSFPLWLFNTAYWQVTVRVERAETIDLPRGRTRAWRVRARPNFSQVAGPLDRLIGLVLPPFVLHFDHDPPHGLLRFEFPTGPFLWNPRALIEAL
jgi:hypothetical protein